MKKLKVLFITAMAMTAFYACDDDKKEMPKEVELSKAKLTTPVQNANNVEVNPTFKWEAVSSPKKGNVSYELLVSKDENFGKENTKTVIDIQNPMYTFTNDKLANFTQYYWKVVAQTDDKKMMSESEVHTFKTIDVDLKVNLLTPENKSDLEGHKVKLTWDAHRNSTFDKEVTYSVYLRNGSSEFSAPTKKGITSTEADFSDLRGNATYYWTVKAMTGDDIVAETETFSFSTPNTIPTSAKIKTPVRQSIVEGGVNVVIEWTASEDKDRILENGKLRDETLVYDFYLSEDDTFTEDDLKAGSLEELKFMTEALKYNTQYWAKVVTRDENGGKAESKVITFTTKKEVVTGNVTIEKGTWIDNRDGKEYKTVTINGKTWLAENFAYLPYTTTDDVKVKKICSVFGAEDKATKEQLKQLDNYKKYGVLYTVATFEDIVPDGWRVSTDEDWQELEKLSGIEENQIESINKSRGTTIHKFIDVSQSHKEPAVEPTDELQTSIVYGGYYKDASYKGGYKGDGTYTYIWTSTEKNSAFTKGYLFRAFSSTRKGIERGVNSPNYRMYVRLVKENK